MIWLRTDVVLALHRRQVAEHGGQDGIRDLRLLESALARPQNIAVYEADADIARLAAAYGFGIARNHPFIDGNKRTSLVVTRTFLRLNSYELTAGPAEKYLAFLQLAEGTITEDEFGSWLRERMDPIQGAK